MCYGGPGNQKDYTFTSLNHEQLFKQSKEILAYLVREKRKEKNKKRIRVVRLIMKINQSVNKGNKAVATCCQLRSE